MRCHIIIIIITVIVIIIIIIIIFMKTCYKIKVKHIHENNFDPENEYDSPCAWASLYNEC